MEAEPWQTLEASDERTKMIDTVEKKIHIGAVVRVIGATDLKGMHPYQEREAQMISLSDNR